MDHNEEQILDQEPKQETPETPQEPQQAIPQEAPQEVHPEVSEEPETPVSTEAEPVRKASPFADSPYVIDHSKAEPVPGITMTNASPKSERKQRRLMRQAVSAVLVLALVLGSCAVTAAMVNGHWEDRMEDLSRSMEEKIGLLEQELSHKIDQVQSNGNSVSGSPAAVDGLTPGQVYAQNVASAVLVYSESQKGYSSGSGFILTADGYVVTNYHVIEGGKVFTVVTSDNEEHPAELIGGDASNDVAVLKIQKGEFQSVKLGSSDALIVGDQVVAIGNPLGELTSTLTVGYVSAKGRYVTTESTTINMIQTDCAINSGNSGGPLFNMKGEVVAITSAKYSGTSSSGASIEGIGFAIPIDDVMGIIEDLMEFGYVNSAYLGVQVNNQNEIQAGLPDGAYIVEVTPGYCAEKAGIQAGDYIIELDGHEIQTMNDLTRILRRLDPGTTTTVKVLRGTKTITLEITLDQRPRDTGVTEPTEQIPLPEEGDYDEWYEYFKWFFENGGKP